MKLKKTLIIASLVSLCYSLVACGPEERSAPTVSTQPPFWGGSGSPFPGAPGSPGFGPGTGPVPGGLNPMASALLVHQRSWGRVEMGLQLLGSPQFPGQGGIMSPCTYDGAGTVAGMMRIQGNICGLPPGEYRIDPTGQMGRVSLGQIQGAGVVATRVQGGGSVQMLIQSIGPGASCDLGPRQVSDSTGNRYDLPLTGYIQILSGPTPCSISGDLF